MEYSEGDLIRYSYRHKPKRKFYGIITELESQEKLYVFSNEEISVITLFTNPRVTNEPVTIEGCINSKELPHEDSLNLIRDLAELIERIKK